jgi:Asp-tRNA(Asn)/Glu-tRNA(Gln) amidotransferase A subunit family amidase
MPSRSRRSNSRRAFLKTLPTVVATGAAAPQLARAQTGDGITASSLEVAQQLAGIDLPAADRDQARSLVARNRDNFEILRQVQVSSDVEPAFSFRPPRPESPAVTSTNGNGGSAKGLRSTSRSAARVSPVFAEATAGKRPESLESIAFAPISTLASLLSSKQVSSVELTRMYIDRLKRHDPTLLCVVTLTETLALEQAEAADREIRAGHYRGPLHGVPYGIKDLFAAKGFPTTWGAKPYANQVFDYDATVVTRLRDAGAVLVAKLSTGELAVGDLWFRGRTKNPWNPDRGSSGSSAGPAAATSAGLVGFAVGTETGGSIMSPASTCGVVGLRPTYGRVPRSGCMTLRWTLDKVGPLTRSVADAALVLDAIYGPDGHDETVPPVPFAWNGDRSVKGMRIGYVTSEFMTEESPALEESRRRSTRRPVYGAALEAFRQAGATLVPIELPDLPATAIYAVLNAEAGAMFDELVRNGGVNDLADKGSNGRANQLRASRFIPAVEYIRAQRVRTLLMQEMNALFKDKEIDVFLATTQSDSVTITNLTGHPAVVLPTGFVDGLPVGLIVTGKLWDEATVLRVAAAYESATEWHTKHPNVQPVYSA